MVNAQQKKEKKIGRNRSGIFEPMRQTLWLLSNSKIEKNPGINRSGRPEQAQKSYETNTPVILVTVQQLNGKLPGMNR
jgi:hypothetical protein